MATARAFSNSTSPRLSFSQRLLSAVLATGMGTVLGLAAYMSPDSAGHGTHEQIGLPPCAWAVQFDAPCMTCGMTTAYAHAAEGDLLGSLTTQPMGMLLAVGTAVGFWFALYVALTGSRAGVMAGQLLRPKSLFLMAGLAGVAWIYKFITWQGINA
jgi:hypothetical protein